MKYFVRKVDKYPKEKNALLSLAPHQLSKQKNSKKQTTNNPKHTKTNNPNLH